MLLIIVWKESHRWVFDVVKAVKGRKDIIPKNKEGSDLIRPDGGENLTLRMKAMQTRFYF